MIPRYAALAALTCATLIGSPAPAQNSDAVQTGSWLALLLDAGRMAISKHQEVINDRTKGAKGFTPDVFDREMLAIFKQRTGVDLTEGANGVPDSAKPLLQRLREESKKTVASYQTAINISGISYKGLIPATFATETAKRFRTWTGVYLKQTAPNELLRNPTNKPDAYEAAVMARLATATQRPADGIVTEPDGTRLRVLLPLYYDKSCLACHGEPKGERDISGYPKEGGKEGQFGGLISVSLEVR
jgi:general secretion pathway protein A